MNTSRFKLILGFIVGMVVLLQAASVDPSFNNAGARAIGLGNAFSAFANDYQAIYANPAGLAQIHAIQAGGMQNTKLDVVNTIYINGVLPIQSGTLGLSYYSSGVDQIPLTLLDSNNRPYQSGLSVYYDSLIAGSYATYVSSQLAIGLTAKYFMKGTSDGSGKAEAINADVGVLYHFDPKIHVSFVAKNIAPFALKWNTGTTETLERRYVIGGKMNLIGSQDSSFIMFGTQSAVLGIDLPFSEGGKTLPFSVGMEYKPITCLALRAGYTALEEAISAASTGATSRLSLGVGLEYEGFGFDYALVMDSNVADSQSHYFSIAYKFAEPELEKPLVKKEPIVDKIPSVLQDSYIALMTPSDKMVVRTEMVTFKGTVDPKVKTLLINEQVVLIKNYEFFSDVKLKKFGKNVVRLVMLDAQDQLLGTQDVRVLYLAQFEDIAPNHWAKNYIEALATIGLITGYPDGEFKPNQSISRAEYTTVVAKTRDLKFEDLGTIPFNDLSARHWAAKYIMAAYNAGLVKGYPDQSFRPKNSITRAEGVTGIVRMDNVPVEKAGVDSGFKDVKDKHWASGYVKAGVENKLVNGYPDSTYQPERSISRAETAKMFYFTQIGETLIKDLYDWDSYQYVK